MEPTSDTRSDTRFDPHRAAQLLLEPAQERSLEPILKKIVEHGAERTEYVFTQVWLVEKGDLCATCKCRFECPDQSRCLHLVAGKGRSILPQGKGLREYGDLTARVPLNFGPLGEAVASGQLGLVTKSDKQSISIAGFDWLREEGVRCFAISPIRFKGEVLGALVGFTREH